MSQPPDHPTQLIATDPTSEQPAAELPALETASPAWASVAHEGDGAASARPLPVAGGVALPSPLRVNPATPAVQKKSWSSRVGAGRGLAIGALVVGLGLGAVVGSGATWAITHDGSRSGTVADGHGRFDNDREGDFGPPGGRGGQLPGGQPPGGQPGGVPPQNGTGQLPGGGAGTDDSPDSGATGTSQAT